MGEFVYHRMEESRKGLIIDVSFSLRNGQVKYEVVFGVSSNDDVWCYEIELSDTPSFN